MPEKELSLYLGLPIHSSRNTDDQAMDWTCLECNHLVVNSSGTQQKPLHDELNNKTRTEIKG